MTQQNVRNRLFRQEVLTQQNNQLFGSIRIAQPASTSLIAIGAIVIGAALIAFLVWGEYTRKAHTTGITVPIGGSISITAPVSGVIVNIGMTEGQAVEEGQPLFEISTERQGNKGGISMLVEQQLNARVDTVELEKRARLSQYNEKKSALKEKISNVEREQEQLHQEIGMLERRYDLAKNSVENYQKLQASGYVSSAQLQQKQEELIDIEGRLSTLRRGQLQLESSRIGLLADRHSIENDSSIEQAQLQRSISSLQQERAENNDRRANLVLATHSGLISTFTARQGQAVSAGQVLATLSPAGNAATDRPVLEVHLYAPSKAAGFIKVGQPVLIRLHAFPYQKFGLQKGQVTEISGTPFAPNELPSSLASTILSNAQQNSPGANNSEALYRIKLKLDKQTIDAYGKQQALKSGMTLEADILQEKRKLWEWIAEPLLAAAQKY